MIWVDTHIHVSDVATDGSRRERMLADLLDVLERSGHDLRFVISCDFPYMSNMRDDPDAIAVGNEMIWRLVREAPGRLYGSCLVNPRFLDASLRSMEQCFGAWGFVQLGEMLPYIMGVRMDDANSERLVCEAVQYDVPVQVHIGTYWARHGGPSTAAIEQLEDLLNVAERVPEAKYILAHAIGCGPTPAYVPWAGMILDAMAGIFGTWPANFWIEVRDFNCPALPRAIAEVPTDKLLAGTDWTTRIGPPFQAYGTMFDVAEASNPFAPGVDSFVTFLRAAGASDEDIERIGSRNALELLGLTPR